MSDTSWDLIFELLDELQRSVVISDDGMLVIGYQLEAILDSKGFLSLAESVKKVITEHQKDFVQDSVQSSLSESSGKTYPHSNPVPSHSTCTQTC